MIARLKNQLNDFYYSALIGLMYVQMYIQQKCECNLKRLITIFCIICGASINLSFAMLTDIASNTDIIDQIVGPFGALVISVVLLYIVWRYMLKLVKRNDDIQKERIEEYKRKIDELERNRAK